MKIKMFAAAAAALMSTGAFAQSSVTLYGVADVGVEWVNKVPGADGNGHSRVAMQSGNLSGSRWGLRGVEDLGSGLKGIFNLESGFNLDTGTSAQGGRLFGRNAFVGLQGQWGQLTLGRQQNLLYDFGTNFDPMGIAGRYSLGSQDNFIGSGRADNSLKYVGAFNGVSVSGLYALNYNGNEMAGVNKLGREWSAGVGYAAGPLAVGAVYDQTNGYYNAPNPTTLTGAQIFANSAAAAERKEQRATIGASYAVGPAKLFGGYRWYKANFPTVANIDAGNVRSNLYWLGVAYQATPALSLTGAAYYQQFKNAVAMNTGVLPPQAQSMGNPWLFVVSADYALSKRTDAYLNLAYAKNSSGSGLGVAGLNDSNYGIAGTPYTLTSGGQQVFSNVTNGSSNQFGAVVGVRHKF
ncbi:porin [Ralstonia sp. 1138]|uniref:porin n=1 Tax=Ralstonia sp. 1138 TaxID=3156423 RepID=UPI00339912DE